MCEVNSTLPPIVCVCTGFLPSPAVTSEKVQKYGLTFTIRLSQSTLIWNTRQVRPSYITTNIEPRTMLDKPTKTHTFDLWKANIFKGFKCHWLLKVKVRFGGRWSVPYSLFASFIFIQLCERKNWHITAQKSTVKERIKNVSAKPFPARSGKAKLKHWLSIKRAANFSSASRQPPSSSVPTTPRCHIIQNIILIASFLPLHIRWAVLNSECAYVQCLNTKQSKEYAIST